VLGTAQVSTPEEASYVVKRALMSYPSQDTIVRVGHGDTTHRNRIINSLAGMSLKIEIADETKTTRTSDSSDIDAAINIALKEGHRAKSKYKIEPTEGELRDIQRRSRIESMGRVTISKREARRVACGKLSLEEAIKRAERRDE
jgi:hypothetical protein